MTKKIILIIFISIFVFWAFYEVKASQDKDSKINTNNFSLSPVKVEVLANPGDTVVRYLTITNNTKEKGVFKLEVDDFEGSKDPNKPVVLLDGKDGKYSLKKYIIPELYSFSLDSGQKKVIPIKVSIPENSEPGGFYATVLVSAFLGDNVIGKTNTIARVGSLFFVRVSGDVLERGSLVDFKLIGNNTVFLEDKDTFGFEFLFENKGSVYLTPYGTLSVRNIFGREVGTLEIDPYYSLPNSLRYRDIYWDNQNFLFGKYTATLNLNRGYDDASDKNVISFWVLPFKVIGFGFLFVSVLIFILFKFKKRRI